VSAYELSGKQIHNYSPVTLRKHVSETTSLLRNTSAGSDIPVTLAVRIMSNEPCEKKTWKLKKNQIKSMEGYARSINMTRGHMCNQSF